MLCAMIERANTGAARTPDEIEQLLADQPAARVLDVRTAQSREASAVMPGSELLDVNADLAAGNFDVLLEQDLAADEPLVIVCNTGGKCTRAAEFLRGHGYDAVSVEGGMQGWTSAGKPTTDA
jgi:rhodanese-related sulfurtransferase